MLPGEVSDRSVAPRFTSPRPLCSTRARRVGQWTIAAPPHDSYVDAGCVRLGPRERRTGAEELVRRAFGIIALFTVYADAVAAQASQVWPELDVFWHPAEHQRTFLELSMSSDRESDSREASVGLYQDYLRLPRGYARAGYRYTFSVQDASYRESRGVGEVVLAAGLPMRMRLLNRARTELRWVNGGYSWRFRERVHVQYYLRNPRFARHAVAPYGTLEGYYDSRYRTIARIGGRIGSEARLSDKWSTDVFIARQNNSRATPRYVTALGVIARITVR
jgi:hypothetical protein